MIAKGLLVVTWFPLTLCLLFINLLLLATLSTKKPLVAYSPIIPPVTHITAQAGTAQILGMKVVAADARGLLVKSFLNEHKSPMTNYSETIVSEADKNGIDFRLLPAIAMCESNLGKRIPSKDSYNPFGIAVYTGTLSGKKFETWEHSIEWVSHFIREKFHDRGITNLYEIGAIWAPPSVDTNYSWTNCVLTFMEEIQ